MGIRYEGRYPDADLAIATKQWADDTAVTRAVTPTFVSGEIARIIQSSNLQAITYVNTQDGLLAKLADVQSAYANVLPATARNTTVAPLDASGMIASAQLPSNMTTDRVAKTFTGTAAFSGTTTSTSTTIRDKKLASVTITDPGYAYIPLPFGSVTAQAGSTPGLYGWSGNAVCGQLTVAPPPGSGDTVYGLGGCSDSPIAAPYPLFPYGGSGVYPGTQPSVSGNLTLDLYGCCFQGSGYTFSSTGLVFYVIIMPAL